MADSGSEDERDTSKMSVKFKTTSDTLLLEVGEKWAVSKVKSKLAAKINQPAEKICLIFSGKILKDHENLSQHKISDGMVIHMVIRGGSAAPARADASAGSPASSTAAPPSQPAQQQGTVPPNSNPLMGGAEQLLGNQDFIREMMNSPLIQNVLGNPDVLQSLFANNPQIQAVIQNNPELGHLLRDPEIMRQTMEMMRNPAAFNEMMRNHDQAVRNLQGIPGGEAALQRLYQDIQEPLTNSVLGQFGGNPYGADGNQNVNNSNNANADAASRSQRAGVENAEALPNPWQGIAGGRQPNAPGAGGFENMMNAPGIQSLFRQITANPAAMQSLVTPDSMARMAQMMGQNPELMQQMMQGMAGMGGAGIADQLQGQLPNILNMMGNQQVLQSLSNPRIMQALQQIQQAYQVIRDEAPHLLNIIAGGMGGMFGGIPAASNQPQPAAAPANDAGEGSVPPLHGQPPDASIPPAMLAQLMQQMMSLNNANNAPTLAPEERFRAQLEQLATMGFTNQQANIEALTATFGNLEAAIERLLGGGN